MTELHDTRAATGARARGGGWAVAAVVTCQLMLMVDGVIVTVALPYIRDEFGLSAVGLSWVVSAYALAFAGFLLVSGRLGTMFGPRRVLLAGAAVFVVASAAGGLAPTGELLIAARAVQGVGAALAGPAIMVLLVANTDEGPQRLRAMSWFIIGSSLGSCLGLVAGGVLTVALDWRWVMLINVPVGAAVIAGTVAFVRDADRTPGRLDVPGAIASAVTMVALVHGLTRAGQEGWGDPVVLGSLVLALMALVVLIAVESRAAHPVVPLRLLAGARRAVPYAGMLLVPAMMIGFFTFSVLFLQDVRHFDALEAGIAYLPWGASVIIGARLVPVLIARIGSRMAITLGTTLGLVGLVAFALLAADAPLWVGVLVPCFVFGFVAPLFFTPASAEIMAAAGAEDAGAAAGLFQSMQQLGGAIGVATLTAVFTDRAAAGTESAMETAMLASTAFGACLLVLVLATPAFTGQRPAPTPA
ncbi:MFS transporter [Nocardioides sp. NPDC051685]|uniref:MFS transporter n=1 Tax=Nocardioides sp. NPDC051685 TaxID=3364334 RepID=UPI0037939C31